MSVSDNGERGMKLLGRHSSDGFAGIPIKKRKFPLVRSPSPPLERPPLLLQSENSILESKSSLSNVGGQVSSPGNADYFGKHKGETGLGKDEHLALNSGLLPGSDHHQSPTSDVNSGMGINIGQVLSLADKSAYGPIATKSWSGPTELFKASTAEGSGEWKLVQSDTSAFHRVLATTNLQVTNGGVSYLQQEKPDPCPLDLALAQARHDTQIRTSDVETRVDFARPWADRIHWDLNTSMDTWERSFSDGPVNHVAGVGDGTELENVNERKLETCPIEMIDNEPKEIHAMLQETDTSDGDWCLRLSNSTILPNECKSYCLSSNSLLNMTGGSLSPLKGRVEEPFTRLNSFREVADLCLSVKPVVPKTDLKLSAVKSEPCKEDNGKDTKVSHLNGGDRDSKVSNQNLSATKTVKFEPVEGVIRGSSQAIGFGTVNLGCHSAVKSEPQESHHKGLNPLEQKDLFAGHHKNLETPISMVMQHDAKSNVCKPSDLVSKLMVNYSYNVDQVSDGIVMQLGGEMPTNVQIHQVTCSTVSRTSSDVSASPVVDSSNSVQHPETFFRADTTHIVTEVPGKAVTPVLDSVAHDVNKFRNDKVVPLSTVLPQDGNQIVCKASDLGSESMVTLGKGLTAIHELDDMVDRTSNMHAESIYSAEKLLSDDKLDIEAQVPCLDGVTSTLPTFISPNEQHFESNRKADAFKGAEEKKIGLSDNIQEGESQENENKSEGSNNFAKGNVGGDEYEDGEVRDQQLLGVVQGSCEESEANHVHREEASDLAGFVNACATSSLDVDKNKIIIPNPDEPKDILCAIECDNTILSLNDSELKTATNDEESTAIGVLTAGAGMKKPTKVIHRVLRNPLGKEKGRKTKPVSKKTIHASGDAVAEDTDGDKGSEQVKADGPSLPPENPPVLSKVETSINSAVDKHASGGSQSRIIHLNTTLNGSSTGRTKNFPSRLTSSRIETGGINNKSFRVDKPHPWDFRGERRIDRLQKVGKGRNRDEPPGKPGIDNMHVRGRASNHLDALGCDWGADSKRFSDHFNGSKNIRFPRFKNASEISFTARQDGLIESVGRGTRKPIDDEFKNSPRLPSRRQTPGGRVGALPAKMQMVHRRMRDTSPGRCTEGGDANILLNHGESMSRELADDMVNPSFFYRPNFKYERKENTFIKRERRSLSPVQRRGPLHLTSPRSRLRYPRLWSPPQRSDCFDVHPELIHCRSPPIARVDQMRSPHQRGCFPEDMLARRRGSPPYMSRLSDEMRDPDPTRKDDYPKSSRGMQRPIRRFDLIDRSEDDEEYFGPLHMVQVHERVDDEFVDGSRNNAERHVLGRPFRQHYSVGDVDDAESFDYRVADDRPRTIRFCAEAGSEFLESGASRVVNRSIRNRLGNMPRRLRGMEEQIDELRDDGGQRWHDAGFNDPRSKRRRF